MENWTVIPGDDDELNPSLICLEHEKIAETYDRDTAELIVSRLNAHDDLLEACEAIIQVRIGLDLDETWQCLDDAVSVARAAIAKAMKGT